MRDNMVYEEKEKGGKEKILFEMYISNGERKAQRI